MSTRKKSPIFLLSLFTIISLILLNINQIQCEDTIYPSLRYLIKESEIKKVEEIIIKKFLSEKDINIPPLNFKQNINFIGTVQLDVLDSKLNFVNITSDMMQLNFVEPDLIIGKLENLEGILSFYYNFKSNFYENKGQGKISLSEIKMEIKTNILQIQNKKKEDKKCLSFSIENIKILSSNFHFEFEKEGDLEKILIFLVNNLKNAVMEIINDGFNDHYREIYNKQMEEFFSNQELSYQINNSSLFIDYSMNSKPIISNSTLEMSFEAMFRENEIIYKGQTYDIPKPYVTTSTVDFIFSQYIFENYFYILYTKQELNYHIKNEDLLFSILIVSTFSKIFPQLNLKYSNDEEVELNLKAFKEPKFLLKDNESFIYFYYNSAILIHNNETGSMDDAVSGDCEILLNITFTPVTGKVSLEINDITLNSFTNIHSKIGEITEDETKQNFGKFMETLLPFIKTMVKAKLESITFPTIEGITFEPSFVESHDKSISMGVSLVINETDMAF